MKMLSLFLSMVLIGMLVLVSPALAQSKADTPPAESQPIRIAVFDFDVLKGIDLEPAALTDRVNMILSGIDKVTIVNRDQIRKVAEEHQMALSGLVDANSAAQIGRFMSASHVIVGRASRIGQTNYLVLKIINVETTEQKTISTKAAVDEGLDSLIDRLEVELTTRIKSLNKPVITVEDQALAKLKKAASSLSGKVFLVDVSETHINRPLVDPAAQMAIFNRLRMLGVKVIATSNPADGWKKTLLETGKYADQKVDFMIEGEGMSAYAATLQGLVSCRARVELRMISLPGTAVTYTDRGVAARVDLVEALAAKSALEDAGVNALDAIILQYARAQESVEKAEKSTAAPEKQ